MSVTNTDEFVITVRRLFLRRKILFVLVCICVSVFIIPYPVYLSIIFVIGLIIIVPLLTKAEVDLYGKVWDRFGDQLSDLNVLRFKERNMPLDGVMGSIGDSRYVSSILDGTYNGYPIRLLRQNVCFGTSKSPNGVYYRDYRVLEITTKQNFYHVFIDSRQNHEKIISTAMNILSLSVRGNKKLSVEGDVNKYFKVYVPNDAQYESLITLTPNKLIALRDYGKNFDIEFVNNKIYLITKSKLKGVKDVLIYQDDVFTLLDSIGVDVTRKRDDVSDLIAVRKPDVLTF